MADRLSRGYWWASVSVQIAHATLQPDEITALLGMIPEYAYKPGESKIHHGESKSAGYWCGIYRIDDPVRPDKLFEWVEEFVAQHQQEFEILLSQSCSVDAYIGVHPNVVTLGFMMPPTPTLWKLGIPVSMEIFGR